MALAGAKPVTATHPIEAARRLRVVMKTALALVQHEAGGRDLIRTGPIRTGQEYWHRNVRTALDGVEERFNEIEQALKERKTAPGLESLKSARSSLLHTRENLSTLSLDLESRLSSMTRVWEGDLKSLIREAYALVQCLPTVEDLPLTDAENTLRAIVALLRHHRWSGVEGLTQNSGKEDSNGKAEGEAGLSDALNQLAEAAGKPEPVGHQPN